MLDYGTNVMWEASRRDAVESTHCGVDVFDTMKQAVAANARGHHQTCSCRRRSRPTPSWGCDAGIEYCGCIIEGIPVLDMPPW